MTKRRLACFTLAAALATTAMPAAPALADGAASTRNIIIGGAAAALLIINHNRKVHEKYAEKDRAIARQQARASDAESAYYSERQAYNHEAALRRVVQARSRRAAPGSAAPAPPDRDEPAARRRTSPRRSRSPRFTRSSPPRATIRIARHARSERLVRLGHALIR